MRAGVPVLVVQGDRDPFGMPPPGPGREIVVITGADHSLKRELGRIAASRHRLRDNDGWACECRLMAFTNASNAELDEFRGARDLLLRHRSDYDTARAEFEWPRPEHFNFAIDWFDGVLAAEHPHQAALRLIEADGTDASYTFAELSARSDQLAGWLRGAGVRPRHAPARAARQSGRAVGDHAGRDEARRGDHPGHHAAGRGRPARPHRARSTSAR